MWRRSRTILWGLVAAAVSVAGCANVGYEYAPRQDATAGGFVDDDGDEVRMDAAKELITKLQYAEAAGMLEKVVFRDRSQAVASAVDGGRAHPEAMFWLAFCREKTGKLSQAVELYQAVESAAPQTRYARQAASRRGRIADRIAPEGASIDE